MDSPHATLAVVISAYNYARFLPDALESVLSQAPPFDEVIVVDDGSTDNTSEVLDAYRHRATVIETENRGQVAACLAGMRAATADYVYLLDADDFLAPGMVAAVQPLLESRPAKVQFQLACVDAEGDAIESVFPTYPTGYNAHQMREDNRTLGFYLCPTTSGNVVDRERTLAVGLDPAARPPHIDATGILIQPYLGEVVSLARPLAYYRVHGGNLFNAGWSRPTVGQLQRELEQFAQAWIEAQRVLQLAELPFGDRAPLYVLERELMIGALENRWWLLPQAARYVRRLASTHMPAYSKLLLAGWAMALAMPLAPLRRRLIDQRRNPTARSTLVKRLVRRRAHPDAANRPVRTKVARSAHS